MKEKILERLTDLRKDYLEVLDSVQIDHDLITAHKIDFAIKAINECIKIVRET